MPDISVSPKVDPITKILTKQSPSIRDVGKALLRSSTGKTTYGEALNTIRAKELNEAKVLHGITTQNKQLDQADQRIALESQRIDIDKARLAAQSNVDKQFIEELDKIYGDDAPAVLGAMNASKYKFDQADLAGRRQAASNFYNTLRQGKKLPSQAVKPKAPAYKNITYPDGEKSIVNISDPAEMKRAQKQGGVLGSDKPSSTRYQYVGPYVDPDGQYIGEASFDRQERTLTMADGSPLPPGAQPRTEGSLSKNVFSGTDFEKLASRAAEEERSLRAIQNYMGNVTDTQQGLALLADQLYGQFKTIFGKDITPEEYRTMVQEGQLQRLLGGFRKEVVGGGVMTEYDARRVLMALGGDVGLLRNKKVATSLLTDIMSEKAREYNEVIVPLYNAQLKATSRGKFSPKELIDIGSLSGPDEEPADKGYEGVDPGLLKYMTPEQRKLFKKAD